MMTDSDWLDHWVSAAPTLSSEALETITQVLEEEDDDELLAA